MSGWYLSHWFFRHTYIYPHMQPCIQPCITVSSSFSLLTLPLSSTSCACYLCTLSLVSGSQETGDLPSRQVVPEYPSGSEPACESPRVGTGALSWPNTELDARCGQGRCLVSPLLATAALRWLSKSHSKKPSRPSSNARFFLSTGFPQSRKLPYEDETVKST